MPHHFGIAQHTDRFTVLGDIGHDDDFRMRARFFLAGFCQRREIELTQAPAEGQQVRITQLLAADADHQVVEQGLVDLLKRSLIQPAHVAAGHFGTQGRCQRFYRNGGHDSRECFISI